jgi:basic amino acid/polyamine antiporter, APA family
MNQHAPAAEVFKDELAAVSKAAYRVLVPVANPATVDALLVFASAVARRKKGDVTALHVVSQLEHASQEEMRRSAEGRRTLLEETIGGRHEGVVSIHTMTCLSEDPAQAILDTARKDGYNLIIMGWQGHMKHLALGPSLGAVLDPVIAGAPCDVAIVKTKGFDHPRRLLIPTAGGPNAILALDLAVAFGWRHKADITLLNIGRRGQEEEGRRYIAKTLAGVKTKQRVRQDVVVADDPVKAILREARDYDMVLLGATHETVFQQVLFGTVPEHVAKRCPKTVVMVKGYRGPLVSLVRRGQNRWQSWLQLLRNRLSSASDQESANG